MDLGDFQLGHTLRVYVRTTDGTSPAVPDDCPQMKVFAGTTLKKNVKMPVLDPDEMTGLFYYPLFLGTEFDTGQHSIEITWSVGSYSGVDIQHFAVVAGGDADGRVTSMTFFHRPHADFVVHGLETGSIKKGRNPRVA